jgi:uncharacterized membrane protein YgaE (UPF0421/DUF939 family)
MKRLYFPVLLGLISLITVLVHPAFAAQDGTVVASAVITPVQISEMGFLTSAPVKEVFVKEATQYRQGNH